MPKIYSGISLSDVMCFYVYAFVGLLHIGDWKTQVRLTYADRTIQLLLTVCLPIRQTIVFTMITQWMWCTSIFISEECLWRIWFVGSYVSSRLISVVKMRLNAGRQEQGHTPHTHSTFIQYDILWTKKAIKFENDDVIFFLFFFHTFYSAMTFEGQWHNG